MLTGRTSNQKSVVVADVDDVPAVLAAAAIKHVPSPGLGPTPAPEPSPAIAPGRILGPVPNIGAFDMQQVPFSEYEFNFLHLPPINSSFHQAPPTGNLVPWSAPPGSVDERVVEYHGDMRSYYTGMAYNNFDAPVRDYEVPQYGYVESLADGVGPDMSAWDTGPPDPWKIEELQSRFTLQQDFQQDRDEETDDMGQYLDQPDRPNQGGDPFVTVQDGVFADNHDDAAHDAPDDGSVSQWRLGNERGDAGDESTARPNGVVAKQFTVLNEHLYDTAEQSSERVKSGHCRKRSLGEGDYEVYGDGELGDDGAADYTKRRRIE